MIERMVQTVKQCMKKCTEARLDPYLAMLIYRATPLSNSIPSPAELLNGRYRALLPTRTLMHSPHEQIVREQMIAGKDKRSELYKKPAKDLHPLSEQQKVFVQVNLQLNRWTPAVVTRVPVASQPRSYSLETLDGAQLQRNCRFIHQAAPI